MIRKLCLLVLGFGLCSIEARAVTPPPYNYLEDIDCRVGTIHYEGNGKYFNVLNEVLVNTISPNPSDYTFGTVLPTGKKLTAMVKKVNILHPADQFAVRLHLNDSLLFQVGHIDLDIYFELVVDNTQLFFHCMPNIPE